VNTSETTTRFINTKLWRPRRRSAQANPGKGGRSRHI